MNTSTFFIISRSLLLRMGNVSDKSCRENQNTHFLLGNFCLKFCRLWENVEKYCRAGKATDDNMAHAHCMLDTYGYKYTHTNTHTHTYTHTLRLYNIHSFSTATVVARMRLNVTLYVHWLSCVFCLYHTACFVISRRVIIVTNSRHSVNSWPPKFSFSAVNRRLSLGDKCSWYNYHKCRFFHYDVMDHIYLYWDRSLQKHLFQIKILFNYINNWVPRN